jgi:hypothetical protein
MAKTSSRPTPFRTKSGNAAIVVVVHDAGGHLYLDPTPGGERVRQGCKLAIVAVNLTDAARDVEVEFAVPIDGTTKSLHRVRSVRAWDVKRLVIPVPPNLFRSLQVRRTDSVIVVKYTVKVGDFALDPELEIER